MLRYGFLLLGLAAIAFGQGSDQRFSVGAQLNATSNDLGLIFRVDPTLGYRVNRHASLEAGIPVYYVRPSQTALSQPGFSPGSGLGNAHFGVNLNFASETVTYAPSITLTAPTGDEKRGLSTGSVTWDWNNLFQRSFGRVTPFGAAGLANAIADTPLYSRAYISKGTVAHFEGGALFAIAKMTSLGGSLYDYEPTGRQTVISRVVEPPAAGGSGNGMGHGRNTNKKGVFETAAVTQGSADIARDRGASLWLTLAPAPRVSFSAGYSRSATYAMNTVFFGFNVKFF